MCKINPRVDFAFKKLFGSENNKDLLISLINSIVSEKDQVQDVILKNPYNFATFLHDKMSIVDIKAQGTNNLWFDIEMQISEDSHYDKRSLYYWAKMLTEQIGDGKAFKSLTKTICINILNFNIRNKEDENYHSQYKILNEATNKSDSLHNLFKIHYIELERFNKEYPDLKTALDRWVAFLKTAHKLNKTDLPKTMEKDESIIKAIDEVDRMFNEEEREQYINRRDTLLAEQSELDTATEKGLKKGREEGEKKGREEGIKDEKIKTACKMLNKDLDIDFISEMSGLSQEEIKGINC